MPIFKALTAVLCPTANHIHYKRKPQGFQLLLFYLNLIPNVQIIRPPNPTSLRKQHQNLCVVGNLLWPRLKRQIKVVVYPYQ